MTAFLRDLRYAARILRRTPAFSLTAIATLALVIGANSAVFSLADRILLRPLPYPEPDRLALVDYTARSPRGVNNAVWQDGFTWEALRDHATKVDRAVYVNGNGGVNLVVGRTAAFVRQQRVGAGFFRVLGVRPLAGREFTPAEDVPNGPAVAILSHGSWRRVFNGDPAIVGKTINLRGEPHEVIGIMPERFLSTNVVDLWTPVRPSTRGEGGGTNYQIVVRLHDGVSWADAEGDVRAAGNDSLRRRGLSSDTQAWLSLVPMQQALVADVEQPIALLAAAVGLVLVIACVNLAALLLSRGAGRAKEIATRMALGSGRAAVARQLMAESLVLAAIGGSLGAVVGYGALEGLKALGGDIFEDWLRVGIDGRALAVTAAIALATSVFFGWIPAWQASRLDVQTALHASGSRGVAGGRHRLRQSLIIGEVALGVLLLVNAGLLVRTVINLRGLNPGFDATHLVTASVSLQDARYATSISINRLFDDSVRRLERAPGVDTAAVSLGLPYERLLNSGFRLIADAQPGRMTTTNVSYVTPRFFETLRIPVKRGRGFTVLDRADAPPVVVVNETFGRIFLANEDPIGRRLQLAGAQREIVGVAGDVQQRGSGFYVPGMVRGPLTNTPQIYVSAAQYGDGQMRLVHTWFTPVWTVRAARPADAAAALRQAIVETDPELPVAEVRTMAAVMDESMGPQRLLMTLVGALAAAAVLLATIGIYGLIAQAIAERTREIGIRMALGATAARTIRSAALSGVVLSAIGVAIGTGLAYFSVQLVQSFLWGVSGHDPVTFAAVAGMFLLVAAAASVLPALRILRLGPAATLRA